LRYLFENYLFDTNRRELRRGAELVAIPPQVFDLLDYLIRNREHVVSKDDLIDAIWKGRIVSETALTTRLNAARNAIGDTGEEQRLIKTLPRKGFRFVGTVREAEGPAAATAADSPEEPPKPALTLPDKPSIAVLPFTNLSSDPEQEYFADGIVEDIITALSRFKSLFVIARNSSFTYKGKVVHLQQVGRELGVRYVLEGSVRNANGRVRITGQLIDAASGMHLWADKLDGTLEDIFQLQDTVTEQVVTAILPRVRTAEMERAQQQRPGSLHAYDSVLQAQALRASRRLDDNQKALALLERAIALQPNYALAHALSATCYTDRYMVGNVTDVESVRAKAMHHIQKAIELDSDDAEVLVHAAITIGIFDDSERGAAMAERAVNLNVNSAQGWFVLGAGAMYLGDHARALDCEARALRLNPAGSLRVQAMSIMAMSHFLLGQHNEAHVWAERAYQENPNFTVVIRALVLSSVATGNLPRARMAFERFATDLPKQLELTKRMMKRPEDFEKFSSAMRTASSFG
jgi:TolB-like protein/Tfp pilus assembly protein PilF